MNIEARRKELFDLMDRGRNAKLLHGGSSAALGILRRAERLMKEMPGLPPANRALIRYRLGHLLLRASPGPETLCDAEQCFSEAARSRALGPWPHIYRLAVLSRLRNGMSTERERGGIDRQLVRTRDAALASLSDEPREQLQSGPFNAVELATYFLELSYTPLEGLAVRRETELNRAAVVVGPDPLTAQVWMSWASCVEELDQRGEAEPSALLFQLPPGGSPPRYRSAVDPTWRALKPQIAHVLAGLLSEPRPTRGSVEAMLYGDAPSSRPDARLRQALSRTRSWIRTAGALETNPLVSDASDGLSLAPGVRIFGAVCRRALLWS